MATNMLGTLLEAALFLEERDKLSSQSEFSSSPTTSSTASSPSTSSPTILHRPLSSAQNRHSGPAASPTGAAASWSVKMSAGSPTMVMSVAGGGLSPQTPGAGSHVVSTNQSQYPTAKAVSLSVANLPQQTAAIPLIINQQQQQGGGVGGHGASVSISASTKYGQPQQLQQQQLQSTAALLNSISPAGLGAGGTGGITRIVHNSSGNILHLPSGTAAAAVNSAGGATFSTLVRVNGNGNVDNITEEQFDNDTLPPSLVVISPQNFAAAGQPVNVGSAALANSHHGQTISIIPAPPPQTGGRDGGGSGSNGSTGLDLSHVDFVHSTNGVVLSSNQKSTNTFDVTTTNLSKKNLLNQMQQPQSVFVNRKSYPGLDLPATTATKVMGSDSPLPSTTVETVMKSTNMVSAKAQPLLANGLLGASVGGALHFQHTLPLPSDKPEDLSSHLTFNLGTPNGYPACGESVNNILSKTTGTTLVGGGGGPIINLGDLPIDPQQLQDVQQQQSLYQMRSVMTPASATSSGRRRTTSNNSTGGSQRSPSSMRSGTRESHNKLEKNRRAQMRMCFDQLKKQLPKGQEEKKTSNLSILSSALSYIMTLKRTDLEGEHELERLVKEKIELQNKLTSLRRELGPHLDKDPNLASLVAGGDIQRSVRTSESGADEASSMDGYPSNGDETDSFRGGSIVDRSQSPRNMSPLVISGTINGNKLQMLGDQVSVEVKTRDPLPMPLLSNSTGNGGSATILAVPNISQVNLAGAASSQLPLTAINLSSATNPNNHMSNGVLSISSSSCASQQIITSAPSSFVHTISNGQHVIMKGGTNNGFNKANGLIIREAVSPASTSNSDKILKFGNGDNFEPPPTKIMKLVNGGLNTSTSPHLFAAGTDLTTSQSAVLQHSHAQVLPIYTSTPNGLRVISHHPTVTSTSNGSLPPNVVFSDPSSKYQQHLPSGMVISGTLPTSLSHQYLTNTMNGTGGVSTAGTSSGQPVHKLLLTGMPPNIMTQTMSTGYSLPQMGQSGEMFARGSTSLPGGAQLNICRSPSSTPSPTISISSANTKGSGMQKGNRGGAQLSGLPLANSAPQIVSKVITSVPTVPVVSVGPGPFQQQQPQQSQQQHIDVKPVGVGPKKRAANGSAGTSRAAAKRKNTSAATPIMITSQTSLEPVKSSPQMLFGKGFGTSTTDATVGGGANPKSTIK